MNFTQFDLDARLQTGINRVGYTVATPIQESAIPLALAGHDLIGTAQTGTFIAGIVTAGVDGATVQVDGNGQLGVVPSSARYKQDITPMGSRSEKVLDLRPVTFAYKDDARGVTHYGLIAEEVAAVYPDLVTRTATGEVQTVKYQELIPMLLNELQRQRQELAELRALVGQGRGAEAVIPSPSVASKP